MPKRYVVPQYIEMADKIIGPLSIVQFLYLLAGGAICYLAWTLLRGATAILITLFVAPISVGLALVKINDQPLPKMALAGIQYLLRPKEFIWRKTAEAKEIVIFDRHLLEKPKKSPAKIDRTQIKSQLAQLATLIDAHGWHHQTGQTHGPGEEAFKMRIKSHQAVKPSHLEK